MGFEPGTSRLLSERATTELRRLMSTEWIKVHLVYTCANFRNLPVARVRCSKIICRLFCHLIFVSFCCLPIKKFADSKEFTKCNSRKIILLHLHVPSATGKFLKITQVKTRWTFIHSVVISLRSSVVARSLSKREVPSSNPTVGKNFTFCNSRSTRDPAQL